MWYIYYIKESWEGDYDEKNNYIIDKDWAESVVLGDFESEETEELSDDLKDIIKSIYEENYE